MLAVSADEAAILGTRPLASLSSFVEELSRSDRGLHALNTTLPFDVSAHEAARTAVAKSMMVGRPHLRLPCGRPAV